MPDAAALVVAMSAQLTQFEKDIKRAQDIAQKGIEDIENKFATANVHISGLDELGSRLSRLLTVGGVVEAIRQLGELNAQVAHIGDNAEKVGTTTDALQRLQYAAVLVGSSTDKMDGFLDAFSRKVGEAATGTGMLYEQLKANGIAAKDFAALPLTDQLAKFADLITGVQNPAKQLNLLVEASSRNFTDLIPLFRGGADTLKDFMDRAEEVGPVLSKNMIDKAKETNIEYQKLLIQLRTFWQQAALDAAQAGKGLAAQSERDAKEVQQYWEATVNWLKTNFPGVYNAIAAGATSVFSSLQQSRADIATASATSPGGASFKERFSFDDTASQVSAKLSGEKYDYAGQARDLVAYGNQIIKTTTLVDREQLMFQKLIDVQDKSIAMSKAEGEQLGKNAGDVAAARTQVELFAKAKEEHIPLDAARIAQIGQEVQKTKEQAQATDDLKRAWSAKNSAVQFAGDQMVNILDGLLNKTMTFTDAIKNMEQALVKALLQSALLGSGPLAGILGTAPITAGGTGGILGALFKTSGRQSGGPVSAGSPYFVGEHGMELFVPSSSGQIVPGTVSRSGGGGSQITVNNYTATDTQINQRKTSDPINGERYIIDIVKKAQTRGDLDDANRGRFALRPQKVR